MFEKLFLLPMNKRTTKEDKIIQYSSWQVIKDIAVLVKPYKITFFLTTLSRLVGDIVALYPTYAFASIVTFFARYTVGQSASSLKIFLVLWLAATVVRALCQFLSKYYGFKIAERISIDSTLQGIRHLFRLDMAWHERENSGNKIKRINNGSEGYRKMLRIWFNAVIEITVNLILINVIIARFDYLVLGAMVLFFILYFVVSERMRKVSGTASYRVNEQEEQVNGVFFEAINNVRTVKVMAMADVLYGTLTKHMDELMKRIGIRIFWNQSRDSLLVFLALSFRLLMTALIIRGILKGQYDIGFLVLFSTYFSNLSGSVDQLASASQELEMARLSIARMKHILNEPVTIDQEEGKKAFPRQWEKVTFSNVSFAYEENQVLKNISFEIKRGEKVGIIGLSGAGKSTLFKLLLKERENFTGDILFDDLSMKDIGGKDYFKHVSVVLQDTEVFNFSLQDNITMTNSKQKNNQKLLKQALETAHISDFVGKLPNGIDTVIGEKGVKLSGGERQRLGIARAIFKEPQILLLDEATSHLDLESEEKIRDSLHAFFENVTAIVIAHRLTTIKEMDKIIVIEGGEVVESGNFEELQAKKGRFYQLWKKQKL
jgi:ABC-type multidrug transport system fused ATPase/permease subunit